MKKDKKTIVGTIDEDVLEYTGGTDIEVDKRLIEADCIGTAAHVKMLASLKNEPPILTQSQCNQIITKLVKIINDSRRGLFKITKQDQDVHLAVERYLTASLGSLGKRVHAARSRNDQVAFDLRIFSRDQICRTAIDMLDLVDSLISFAVKNSNVPMVGRTHLQPAMPSSVGVWASAFAEGLMEDAIPLLAALELANISPLGSAAGYGVHIRLDRKFTADLLGFKNPHNNVLAASNSRGKCEFVIISSLTGIMITLSRLAEDLIIFSMPEFSYFRLPSGFCTGSSIMPQKRNPDVLELVRARASKMIGMTASVMAITKGLPSGYSRDLQETKEPLIESFDLTRSSLRILKRLIDGLDLDESALKSGFMPEVFAADEALEMVISGMPFREAYNKVKTNLSDLSTKDPSDVIRKRNLHAAPVNYGTLGRDAKKMRIKIESQKKFFESKIASLLGHGYKPLK